MRILGVAEMRALEQAADKAGHSFRSMMAEAGRAVVSATLKRRTVAGRKVLVLVGPGNNGGDGLVASRLFKSLSADTTAYVARPRPGGDDLLAKEASGVGVSVIQATSDPERALLTALASEADIVVDALLGTGAKPPLRGEIAEIVAVVGGVVRRREARTGGPLTELQHPPSLPPLCPLIVAVDGPSGIDFDTGEADPASLPAHITVTFAAPKWGHLRFPAAGLVGELIVADIGIPTSVTPPPGPEVATLDDVQRRLPRRPLDGHKGTFGTVLIVAGSSSYTGAAILAARAAARSGVGLVSLAIPGLLHTAVASAVPEAIYTLLPHEMGVVNEQAAPLVHQASAHATALLVGPGLGNYPETSKFLRRLLAEQSPVARAGFLGRQFVAAEPPPPQLPPLIVDADGLNVLSGIEGWPRLLPTNTILTPHPGEMARLCNLTVAEVQARRLQLAVDSAQEWGHVVVLKGAFTIVAAPDRHPVVIPFANPGLSTGGTGDVLAGTISALRAQGLGAFDAALAGAYAHGLAGEILRSRLGTAGITASELVSALPESLHRLR